MQDRGSSGSSSPVDTCVDTDKDAPELHKKRAKMPSGRASEVQELTHRRKYEIAKERQASEHQKVVIVQPQRSLDRISKAQMR